MRIKRFKKARKVLLFYESNFHFKEPYQILIDGTFSVLALRMKINIRDQLPKYLGAHCDLRTTGCCLHETQNLGPDLHGALCVLKQFSVTECGHKEKPLPANACINTLTKAGNPDKYFVATQDQELQAKLRKRPAVPLIYLHHQSITLEKPSEKAFQSAKDLQNKKFAPVGYQKDTLEAIKKEEHIETPAPTVRRKRRGPKAPNPLSCKKSKKLKPSSSQSVKDTVIFKSKRRHKHLKLPEELKAIHQKLTSQSHA